MMSTLFSPILSPPQFIFFLDKFLQDIISGLPWVLNGSDLQPCQVYTSFYWTIICIRGVLRSSMHSTKTVFKTVPDSKWLQSTWEPKTWRQNCKVGQFLCPTCCCCLSVSWKTYMYCPQDFSYSPSFSFALEFCWPFRSQPHYLENLFMASLCHAGSSVLHHVFELMHMQAQVLRNVSCRVGKITLRNEWEIKIKYSANECFCIQS